MVRSLLLLLLVLPAAPALGASQAPAPASSPAAYRLAPGLWQKRQAYQHEFDASGGRAGSAYEAIQSIDAQYRRFVLAVSEAYARKQIAVIAASCNAVRGDPEARMFCAMVRYRLRGRKDPTRFLAALPETQPTATALDDLHRAAARIDNPPPLAASPVYSVTEPIFRLMVAGNAAATARYFYLFHHSDGAWAGTAASQLETYLTDDSRALIRNWPVLRKYWNLSEGITWDVDANWWESTVARYRRVCSPIGPNCRGILDLLEGAAQAAGAPQ
jgi:hypothetical protein